MKKSFFIGLLTMVLLITAVCCVAAQDSTQLVEQSVQEVVAEKPPLQKLPIWQIVSFIVGLIGVGVTTVFGAVWSVVKEGREAYNAYVKGKNQGWTPKEKDKYIKESGEFLVAIMNLKTILKRKLLGIKKK